MKRQSVVGGTGGVQQQQQLPSLPHTPPHAGSVFAPSMLPSEGKKKGGKKGKKKGGSASKKTTTKKKKKQKVVEVKDEDEDEEGGRDGPKRTTRANPSPSKPSPTTGTRQAMSAQDFFSGSTTSKYFSGEALATEASPSPAKRKEEGGKEGRVKKEMKVVDLEDEVEEIKQPMQNLTTPTAAAAAAAAAAAVATKLFTCAIYQQ
eukprot:evm.model.NODE_33100_length_7234_cov_40.057369.1